MEFRMIPTVLAIVFGLAAAGEGVAIKLQHDSHRRELAEVSDDHAATVAALEADKQALAADLGECRARVTAESITATGGVLQAAQASDIADVGLRAAVVAAMPQQALTEAMVSMGSPRVLAAYSGLVVCAQVIQTGDSAQLKCPDMGKAYIEAVQALAACPGGAMLVDGPEQ